MRLLLEAKGLTKRYDSVVVLDSATVDRQGCGPQPCTTKMSELRPSAGSQNAHYIWKRVQPTVQSKLTESPATVRRRFLSIVKIGPP